MCGKVFFVLFEDISYTQSTIFDDSPIPSTLHYNFPPLPHISSGLQNTIKLASIRKMNHSIQTKRAAHTATKKLTINIHLTETPPPPSHYTRGSNQYPNPVSRANFQKFNIALSVPQKHARTVIHIYSIKPSRDASSLLPGTKQNTYNTCARADKKKQTRARARKKCHAKQA